MRARVKYGLLAGLGACSLNGCMTEPPQQLFDGGTLQIVNDPAGYGWETPCFDPETSEFVPDCLAENIDEVIATLRLDSDGDGMTDVDEVARGSDPRNRFDGPDIDGDGILNGDDPDVDGDGLPNGVDFDIDGDGLPNGRDADADGDGLSGADDPDEDGDGISDRFDLNDDGDGLFDDEDPDDDGDGEPDEADDDGDEDEDDDGADDDDDDGDDDGDDDTNRNSLEDLVQKQRDGTLTDADRVAIAREITGRLDSPQVRDLVLKTLQDLAARSDEPLRDNDGGTIPPQIAAVDAVYSQLSKALNIARRDAGIKPGQPMTEPALRKALAEFIPRAQAMDELSKSFQLKSIGELGLAVNDLRAGLGSPERVREFTQALTRSAVANPLPITEDEELEKLTTGAALLGPTFDDASGGDLLDVIRHIDGLVDSPEALADALRDLRDLGKQGRSLDEALDEIEDQLIGDIPDFDDSTGGGTP